MAASKLTSGGSWLRVAAATALVVSIGLGVVSDVLYAAALQFRPDWFADPAGLVAGGESSAVLLGWAAVADLWGYYLPTGVVALALWTWLRGRGGALADAALAGALGYVIAGSIAAVSLAVAGPSLMRAYAAAGSDQPAIAVTFGFLVDVSVRGIWQVVDGLFIAAWLIGTGLQVRTTLPGFAHLSIGLGVLFLVSAVANILGLGLGRDAVLAVIFALWFVWDAWLAVMVWRRQPPLWDATATAAS